MKNWYIGMISLSLMVSISSQKVLYNASLTQESWNIVDDVVMGGRSDGHFEDTETFGHFYGKVSLENNGGFSSARWPIASLNVMEYKHIVLKVKGDGKRYQLRLKSSIRDPHAYIQYLTIPEDWVEIRLPLKDFYPSFRGRKLSMPNFPQKNLEELGVLIANKKAESFSIKIKKIWLE